MTSAAWGMPLLRRLSYTSCTFMASSRVGNRTSAVAWAEGSLRSISITGIRKARLLPIPVWAVTITSFHSRAGWIARSWIGVKVMNSAAASFCCRAADKGSSVNVVMLDCFFLEGPVGIHVDTLRVKLSRSSHSVFDLTLQLNGGQERRR